MKQFHSLIEKKQLKSNKPSWDNHHAISIKSTLTIWIINILQVTRFKNSRPTITWWSFAFIIKPRSSSDPWIFECLIVCMLLWKWFWCILCSLIIILLMARHFGGKLGCSKCPYCPPKSRYSYTIYTMSIMVDLFYHVTILYFLGYTFMIWDPIGGADLWAYKVCVNILSDQINMHSIM